MCWLVIGGIVESLFFPTTYKLPRRQIMVKAVKIVMAVNLLFFIVDFLMELDPWIGFSEWRGSSLGFQVYLYRFIVIALDLIFDFYDWYICLCMTSMIILRIKQQFHCLGK